MIYSVPEANEALVITGGFRKRDPSHPARIVVGSGVFTIPIIHKVRRFYIGTRNVNFDLKAQTRSNVEINVSASVNYRVDNTTQAIAQAAAQFLGSTEGEIKNIAIDAFSGATRGLIGGMEVEEIISDRIQLAQQVIEEVSARMIKYGWDVTGFQINGISDDDGHIQSLSQPELQRVRKEAEVAKAINDAEVEKQRQETARLTSEYQRDTDLKTSENTIQTAQARAEAERAFDIRAVEQEKVLSLKQTELESTLTAQREVELHNEVVVPAQKEAEARKIRSEADAEAITRESEAYDAYNQMALKRQAYDLIPQVAQEIAEMYQGANLTVVGNNDDMQSTIASAVASFGAIKDAIVENTKD